MIKFQKNELFKFANGLYVVETLAYKLMGTRAGQNTFDRDKFINHPTKGKMFLIPTNLKFEIVK
jgi:hypothetical protein